MKGHLAKFILVSISILLLIAAGCFVACVPSSLSYFVDRWASDPDWSPDGERIAFTCHYPSLSQVWNDKGRSLFYWGYISEGTEICTIQTDGSGLVRLTDNQVTDGHPVWSPDGQRIAYISIPQTRTEIHIIEKDGSSLTTLVPDADLLFGGGLRWSPDGEEICFAAYDSSQPDQGTNLYVATLESGTIRSLTTLAGDKEECRWSPDGRRLAFVWFPEGRLGTESPALRIVNMDKGDNVVLVQSFAKIGSLTWNPDGTRVAFWAYRSADCVNDCTEVCIVDVSDGLTQCLTEQYEVDVRFETAWSPDGEQIAFIARAPEGPGIYTVLPDGTGLSRIAPADLHYHDLVWSPNGQFIALVEGIEGEKNHIWLVQAKTGESREIP